METYNVCGVKYLMLLRCSYMRFKTEYDWDTTHRRTRGGKFCLRKNRKPVYL